MSSRVNSAGDAQDPVPVTNVKDKIKNRLKALKELQGKVADLELSYVKDIRKVQSKYAAEYCKLNTERDQIVMGVTEPTSVGPDDESTPLLVNKVDQIIMDLEAEGSGSWSARGIPKFWLTVFKNSATLSDALRSCDEPILESLQNVKLVNTDFPEGFILEFYFGSNDYFANTILTKQYELSVLPENALSFDGLRVVKSKGCTIDWYLGKDVTLKSIKKRQKHRTSGNIRVVNKLVPNESFFNFFNPPIIPDHPLVEMKGSVSRMLAADYELGQYIRGKVIPHAYLYYIGMAPEHDDNYEDIDTVTETATDSSSSDSSDSDS